MGVRTISKTIDLSQLPKESKYITKINDTGITIHPEVYNGSSSIERSSYIQLDGTGMELFNSNGDSIAKYGEDIRLGNENEGKLLITVGGQGRTYEDAGTYIIDENDNINAQFLEDGATIYGPNNTLIAHLGYGQGYNAQGQLVDAPFYTLGARDNGSAIGNFSVSEGMNNEASGIFSHAEGLETTASGLNCHAEGRGTTASGADSHAEGNHTTASSSASHAEGYGTTANGSTSHAEGNGTTASGWYSHAEGYHTTASGASSHAGGVETTAQRRSQTVIGEFNIADTTGADGTVKGDYALIIGNGNGISGDTNEYSNALTVDWDGNVWCAGGITATPTEITMTYNQCTTGSYSRCYRIGNMVFLSFNINVTTATASYDYITGLPPALGGGWATSSGFGSGAMTRWWVTTSGTLRADGTPTAGWHNGNIVYICQ